jgi:hypothetical protein
MTIKLNPIILLITTLLVNGSPINLNRRQQIEEITLPKNIDWKKSVDITIDHFGNKERRTTTVGHTTFAKDIIYDGSLSIFESKTGENAAKAPQVQRRSQEIEFKTDGLVINKDQSINMASQKMGNVQRRSQEIEFKTDGLVINKDQSINMASQQMGNVKRRSQITTVDATGMVLNSDQSINLAENKIANVGTKTRRDQVGNFDNSGSRIEQNKSFKVGENEPGSRVTVSNLGRRGQSFSVTSSSNYNIDRSVNDYVANYGVTLPSAAATALKTRRDQRFGITSNEYNNIDTSANVVNTNFGGGSSKMRRDQSLDDLVLTYQRWADRSRNIQNTNVYANKKSRRGQVVSVDHSGSNIKHDESTNINMNSVGNSEGSRGQTEVTVEAN